MSGKRNGKQTSNRVATKSSKVLSNPATSAATKSIAASALAQAKGKTTKK